MSNKATMERETEMRAREIAREKGMPESFWEMFLMQAYNERFFGHADGHPDNPTRNAREAPDDR